MAKCELCGCTAFKKVNENYICNQCGSIFKKEELSNTITEEKRIEITPLGKIIFTAIIIGLCVFLFNQLNIKEDFSKLTKDPPIVNCKPSLNGVEIEVYCRDSYSLVEIEVTLYDKNGQIIDKEVLQGKDYYKDSTYTLIYKPNLIDILQINDAKVEIKRYK